MDKLAVVCVDDQRDVLESLKKDLEVFSEYCDIINCESAAEGAEELESVDAAGGHVPLIICDHIMPSKNGVDFLIEVAEDPRFVFTTKVLLTGLATHEDTILAINQAKIDYYFEKPWEPEHLVQTVKGFLTQYIMKSGLKYQSYIEILEPEILYKYLKEKS